MRIDDGFYNNPDPDDDDDVIDVEEFYDSLFLPTKKKMERSCFGSLYEKS